MGILQILFTTVCKSEILPKYKLIGREGHTGSPKAASAVGTILFWKISDCCWASGDPARGEPCPAASGWQGLAGGSQGVANIPSSALETKVQAHRRLCHRRASFPDAHSNASP